MHLQIVILAMVLLFTARLQIASLEQKNDCVHVSHDGDLVADYNFNLTFNFSVSDSENCTKDMNLLLVHTISSHPNVYCNFLYKSSTCAASSRPQLCWCDPDNRTSSVKLHVTEKNEIHGMIQGQSSKGELFQTSFTIRVRYPTEIKLLQVILANGTINSSISSSSITVKKHSAVKLHCFWHEGNPPQNARMMKDGVQLKTTQQPYASNERLERRLEHAIADAQCQDNGMFTCEADGASEKHHLQLIVDCDEVSTTYEPSSFGLVDSTTERGNVKTTEVEVKDTKSLDHTVVLYSSIASVFGFVILISAIFGILFYRKVIASRYGVGAPAEGPNAVELHQLPVNNEAENRDSEVLCTNHVYEEIKDDCRKKTASRQPQMICTPPAPPLPPKNCKQPPSDYFHPVASDIERATSATVKAPSKLENVSGRDVRFNKTQRRRCKPPPTMFPSSPTLPTTTCGDFTLPATMPGPRSRHGRSLPTQRRRDRAAHLPVIFDADDNDDDDNDDDDEDDSALGACGGEPSRKTRDRRCVIHVHNEAPLFATDSDDYLSPNTSAASKTFGGALSQYPVPSRTLSLWRERSRQNMATVPACSSSDEFQFRNFVNIDPALNRRVAPTQAERPGNVVTEFADARDLTPCRVVAPSLSDVSCSSDESEASLDSSGYLKPNDRDQRKADTISKDTSFELSPNTRCNKTRLDHSATADPNSGRDIDNGRSQMMPTLSTVITGSGAKQRPNLFGNLASNTNADTGTALSTDSKFKHLSPGEERLGGYMCMDSNKGTLPPPYFHHFSTNTSLDNTSKECTGQSLAKEAGNVHRIADIEQLWVLNGSETTLDDELPEFTETNYAQDQA